MAHAEALQTLEPGAGATAAIVDFVRRLNYAAFGDEVIHYARRHLLATVGVMTAGAGGEVATRAEAVLGAARRPGRIRCPGRARRADLFDAAFLAGTAATASNSMTASVKARCIQDASSYQRRWRSA